MRKSLFVSLILLSGILLTACGNKSEEKTESENSITPVVSEECKKAVEEYLNGSDKQGEGNEVKAGDNIVVDYIGRLEDGTVFDTSIKSVAEACEIYNEVRDYTEGLSFEAGAGQMVKGFDDGVIGMKLGQTKTVQFGPEKGYGEYDETAVITIGEKEFGDLSQFAEGDYVSLGMGFAAKVLKVTDKDITLDLNHELAGKNLIFDITLKENAGENENIDTENVSEEAPEVSVEN